MGKETSCKEDEEDQLKNKTLMKKEAQTHVPVQNSDVPSIVYEVPQSSGQPLDTAIRAYFEPRFGFDFSQVRVHTDGKAKEAARMVNARAFTMGSDVVFREEESENNLIKNRELLAHELTHVVQQTIGIHKDVAKRDIVQREQKTLNKTSAQSALIKLTRMEHELTSAFWIWTRQNIIDYFYYTMPNPKLSWKYGTCGSVVSNALGNAISLGVEEVTKESVMQGANQFSLNFLVLMFSRR